MFCQRIRRREFLHQLGGGFTSLSLAGMLNRDKALAAPTLGIGNPLEPRPPQLPAKAKSVIFLFMYGGPSHVDTFDYKPNLYPLDGKTIPVKTFGRGGGKARAGWWVPSGSSTSMANAASMFPLCFPTSQSASTTLHSSIQ